MSQRQDRDPLVQQKESQWKTFDARIAPPFGMIVAGPTMSGKTSFLLRLIDNMDRLLTRQFDYIVWFYGEYNDSIRYIDNNYRNKITTVQGLPENFNDYISRTGKNGEKLYGLHIYDDLMQSATDDNQLLELATTKCQHNSISWIIVLQDLFFKSKNRVSLLRCAHYYVIMNNPLDRSIAEYIAQKVMPKRRKDFMSMFDLATETPHGYLFIDGRQSTPNCARYRTHIFDKCQSVFVPKQLLTNDLCEEIIIRKNLLG